jgi:hypothetical protein
VPPCALPAAPAQGPKPLPQVIEPALPGGLVGFVSLDAQASAPIESTMDENQGEGMNDIVRDGTRGRSLQKFSTPSPAER